LKKIVENILKSLSELLLNAILEGNKLCIRLKRRVKYAFSHMNPKMERKLEISLAITLVSVIFMTVVVMCYEPVKVTLSSRIAATDMPEAKPYHLTQIHHNITPMVRTKEDIKYIVVHDTGNTRPTSNAYNHFIYFDSDDQSASADFFVDSTGIMQVNDYYTYYSWHCGDGGAVAKINNRNSVAVEICINSDGDYKETVEKTILLVKILMKELDVDVSHVVRHHDASGKDCPCTMNNADWEYFKSRISDKKTMKNYSLSYLK